MGAPIQFTREHESMLNKTATRVDELERHRNACDKLHERNEEHIKRSGDAVSNLTESNILLAKAVTDLNITVTKLSTSVEESKPVIEFWKNAGTAWSVNKKIAAGIVSISLGIMAVVALWKYFYP